jgi:hypothetical protein
MKWLIDNSSLPKYIRVSVSGEFAPDGYRAMWNDIIGSVNWRAGTSVLIDNSGLKPLGPVAGKYIEDAVRYFVEKRIEIGPACIAIFLSGPEIFRFSRVFEYAIRMRGSGAVVRNFADESSAIEWLEHCGNAELSHAKHT